MSLGLQEAEFLYYNYFSRWTNFQVNEEKLEEKVDELTDRLVRSFQVERTVFFDRFKGTVA
jgi:hypothetical protein